MPQRVLINTPATLTAAFLTGSGDAPTPLPDAVAVTVTASDGTVLIDAHDAFSNGDGTYSYPLTTTETAQLDTLTVDWSAGVAGSTRTYVEVVGGFHFTIPQLRAMKGLENATKYPAAALEQARTLAETAIEDECGVAFVPRHSLVTAYVNGTGPSLPAEVTAIRSVTVGGTAWSADELAGVNVGAGWVYGPRTGWPSGQYVIGVEHGRLFCPPWVSRASMLLARHVLIESPIDDRYTSVSTDVGTFSLVTPGPDVVTAIPEVNSVIDAYRLPVV